MPYMVNTTHDIDALTTSTHANFLSVNRSISDINGVNHVQDNKISANTAKAEILSVSGSGQRINVMRGVHHVRH
jgi:hypothetical protein